MSVQEFPTSHPSPHRGRVATWALWVGVFGAPFCWSVQLLASYAFAAHGCFPAADPRTSPVIGVHGLALGISGAALVGSVASALVAWRSWQATRDEKAGASHDLLDNADGRSRFMAIAGLVLSLIFLLAVAVGVLPALMLGSGCV